MEEEKHQGLEQQEEGQEGPSMEEEQSVEQRLQEDEQQREPDSDKSNYDDMSDETLRRQRNIDALYRLTSFDYVGEKVTYKEREILEPHALWGNLNFIRKVATLLMN